MELSKRVIKIAPSGIRKFFDLVLETKDVISLGVGEPDFVTPWNIREQAIYAIEKGYTSYTSNKGLRELREAVSRFLRNRYSLEYDPDEEILITVGVSEALDLAVRAIINPGQKVLIPEPWYVSYPAVVSLAGGTPIYLNMKAEDGFKLTAHQIAKACNRGIKALIFNYPANPTGVSYSKEELKEIAQVVAQKELIVISDEIYDELTYDFSHTPFASLNGMKFRTIYLNGFSKSYAMTGWRIGFACGTREVISAMTKIHQYTMLCASIVSQMAACEALKGGKKSIEQMRAEYRRRREFIVEGLNKLGLECPKPQGSFYVFPSIKKAEYNSIDFAQALLKKEKVAVVPGVAFGPCGEGHVRISYATSLENLREAIAKIGHFLRA